MLAFQHPNVMTLVGMCFDGEIPLILMPYMSEGSVLGYVKRNKSELLFDREANNEKVYMNFSFTDESLCCDCSNNPLAIIIIVIWK